MDKKALAKQLFALYPNKKEFHVTSDGQGFSEPSDAANHAKTLDDNGVEIFTNTKVVDFEEVKAEKEAAKAKVAEPAKAKAPAKAPAPAKKKAPAKVAAPAKEEAPVKEKVAAKEKAPVPPVFPADRIG